MLIVLGLFCVKTQKEEPMPKGKSGDAKLAFLDCETTGTDLKHHEIWELALIVDGKEYEYQFPPENMATADPTALRINHFYERWEVIDLDKVVHPFTANIMEIAKLTADRHLVGAVPSFDAAFLTKLLAKFALAPAWHYHLIDVEALCAGWLAATNASEGGGGLFDPRPSWDSNELSRQVGVDPDEFDRHTAMGDARWAKALYDAVFAMTPETSVDGASLST